MVSPFAVSVKTDQSLYRPIAEGLAEAMGTASAATRVSTVRVFRLNLSVCIFYTFPFARSIPSIIKTTGLRLNYGMSAASADHASLLVQAVAFHVSRHDSVWNM